MGQTIDGFIKDSLKAIREARTPARQLPVLLNYVTSINRPGLSTSLITSNIIESMGKYGIETGKNPDGTDNVVNSFVYCVVDKIVKGIQEDASVCVTIPSGALTIQAEGANAGGPVVAVGSNILPVNVTGIIR